MKNKAKEKKPSVHDLVKLINQKKQERIKEEKTNTKTYSAHIEHKIVNEEYIAKEEEDITKKSDKTKKTNCYTNNSVSKNHGHNVNDEISELKIQRKKRCNTKETEIVCVQNERTNKCSVTKAENNRTTENDLHKKENTNDTRKDYINEGKLESETKGESSEEESEEDSEKREETRKDGEEENEEDSENTENKESDSAIAIGKKERNGKGNNFNSSDGIKLFMIDYKDCQNKKCSCKKLYRFKKIRKIEMNKKFKGIVLTPFCNKYFSLDDKKIIDTFGLSVIDCSWKSIDILKKNKFTNQRKLPYIIAVNSINYGKAYKLSCLESLAFCLYICNYTKQCNDILRLYKWSSSFITVNKELLDAYKLCINHDAIKDTERKFVQKYMKEKEENKKVDQYTVVYEEDYIERDML